MIEQNQVIRIYITILCFVLIGKSTGRLGEERRRRRERTEGSIGQHLQSMEYTFRENSNNNNNENKYGTDNGTTSTPPVDRRNEATMDIDTDNRSCQLDVELSQCKVVTERNHGGSSSYGEEQPCSTFQFGGLDLPTPCIQTPYAVDFLYNGERCNNNTATTDGLPPHFCYDYNIEEEESTSTLWSYIVVTSPWGSTDDNNDEKIFFQGWVAKGSTYTIGQQQQQQLKDGFRIRIFTSNEDIEKPNHLHQEVIYPYPLCFSSQELLHPFGASQIVAYENELQGKVAPFASIGFNLELTFSIDMQVIDNSNQNPDGDSNGSTNGSAETTTPPLYEGTMTSLDMITDFAGYISLSDRVSARTMILSANDEDDKVSLSTEAAIASTTAATMMTSTPLQVTLDALPTVGGDHTLLVSASAMAAQQQQQPGDNEQLRPIECNVNEIFTFHIHFDLNNIHNNLKFNDNIGMATLRETTTTTTTNNNNNFEQQEFPISLSWEPVFRSNERMNE